MDLSELYKLPNLQKLTLGGYYCGNEKIHGAIKMGSGHAITLPASLTELKLINIQLKTNPNISACKNLATLELDNATFMADCHNSSTPNYTGYYELVGLDEIETLTTATFNNTNIETINLSNTVTEEAQVSGLTFAATNCGELTTVNLGGYSPKTVKTKVKINDTEVTTYETSFRKCSKLKSVTINHGICKGNEVLNLKECTSLNRVTLCYSFPTEDSYLTIDTMGVVPTSDESGKVCNISISDSSTKRYIMKVMEGSFFDTFAKDTANADLFKEVHSTKSTPKYIVFAQDKEKFDKYKKNRDYELLPITMKVGEEIVAYTKSKQFVGYDEVYFYAEDFSLLPDISRATDNKPDGTHYSYNVEIVKSSARKVTDPERDVIYYDYENNKVKAISPGIAKLTITVGTGDNVVSATQNIIVNAPISSISLNDEDAQNVTTPRTEFDCGKYYFDSTLTVAKSDVDLIDAADEVFPNTKQLNGVSGMTRLTIGGVMWHAYKKNSAGNWEHVYGAAGPTSDGLRVCDSSITRDSSTGKITRTALIDVNSEIGGGQFKIVGRVTDNFKNGEFKTPDMLYIRDDLTVDYDKYLWTTPYYFTVVDVGLDNDTIGYEHRSSSNAPNYSIKDLSEVATITLPILGSNYRVGDVAVQNREVFDEILNFWQDGNQFKIALDTSVSQDKIAEFMLNDKDEFSHTKLEVDVPIYEADGTTLARTYHKTINLKAMFTVNYDLAGGKLAEEQSNWDRYYVPLSDNFRSVELAISEHPTREGYTFDGWYSTVGDKEIEVKQLAKDVMGNTLLTAHWKPIEYAVNYKLNHGTNHLDNPSVYTIEGDTSVSGNAIALKAPTRVGHTFIGWFLSEDATEPVTEIKPGNVGDITLYARWRMNSEHVHDYVVGEDVAPTCEEQGLHAGLVCSTCSEPLEDQVIIAPLGHKYDEGTVEKLPTDEEEGSIIYHCIRPGCNHTESRVIPIVEDFGEFLIEDAIDIPELDNLSDSTITVKGIKNEAQYTGKNITFDIRVYAGKKMLKEGRDYSVKYVNNKNVPAADAEESKKPAVIITGKGEYKDTTKYEFTPQYFDITPVDLETLLSTNHVFVSRGQTTVSEGKKPVKPVPSIVINGKKLAKKNYDVSYGEGNPEGIDRSVAGTYEITLAGKGNYTGSVISYFEVVDSAPLISKASVKNIVKKLPYNGGVAVCQLNPEVKCRINNESVILEKDVDYIVRYSNNQDIGTATMIIMAKPGNARGLVGQKTINYKIVGSSMKKLTYTYDSSVDFTGESIRPALVIHDNNLDGDLVRGTDFDIEYLKNVQAGKATMIITGLGSYSGTVKKTFKIKAIDLSVNKGIAASIVPGSVKKEAEGKLKDKYSAEVNVTYNGRALIMDRDYTVTFKNNSKSGKATDGAKAPQVVIKGKGNYTKTLSVPFDIP